jgi:ribosome-associated translation inhibitor RaiA
MQVMIKINVLGVNRRAYVTRELKEAANELQNEMPENCDIELTLKPENHRNKGEFNLLGRIIGPRRDLTARAQGANLRDLTYQVSSKLISQVYRVKDRVVSSKRNKVPSIRTPMWSSVGYHSEAV